MFGNLNSDLVELRKKRHRTRWEGNLEAIEAGEVKGKDGGGRRRRRWRWGKRVKPLHYSPENNGSVGRFRATADQTNSSCRFFETN